MKSSHGVDLFKIQKEYGFNINEIKDFSSNINPLSPSPKMMTKPEKNLSKIGAYPDLNYGRLLSSIEKYTNVSRDRILPISGSTNLISSFTSLINPESAIILNPSYSEYERKLDKINSNIIFYGLGKSNDFAVDCEKLTRMIRENDVSLMILASPNNPTGCAIENEKFKNLTKLSNYYLMVDEIYVEFSYVDKYPAVNLTEKCNNLLVIRSTSKFSAAAGIRLGYSITGDEKLYNDIDKHTNLWNINIFADILGGEMPTDTSYRKRVFKFIDREKKKVISTLRKIDRLEVYPSKPNFMLCEILDKKMATHGLREKLTPYALVIRNCALFNNLNEYLFRSYILGEQSSDKLLKLVENALK